MPPAPSALLVVTARLRQPGRLDWPMVELADPSRPAVIEALKRLHAEGSPDWLGGGEPTLRADLPALIAEAAALGPGSGLSSGLSAGLDTDGLALSQPRVARSLFDLGLRRVRIALHAGRPEAHDWLVGLPGASKRARQAIASCAEAGLEVSASLSVTRPAMDLLPETVALLASLGARRIRLRRLRRRGPAWEGYISLSPRLGLLEPYLEAAVQRGRDMGVQVLLEGFPRCAAPRVPEACLLGGQERIEVPDLPGYAELGRQLADRPPAPGCPVCPGAPLCSGAPADYIERFGRTEIDSERGLPSDPPRPRPPTTGAAPAAPPPRAGRAPATRIRFPRRQAGFEDLGGDPIAGERPQAPPAVLELALHGSSRLLRQQMVRLSQEGAPTLRISGDFAHPAAAELLRDALRLGFSEVELSGDLLPLAALSDRQMIGLRGLSRILVEPAPGPDVEALLERLSRLSGARIASRSG